VAQAPKAFWAQELKCSKWIRWLHKYSSKR